MKRSLCASLLITSMLSGPVLAANNLDQLEELSLESLGDVVTSVTRKPQDSFRSPAAVYVLSNEDIKLSGATHVAEALRMVPGLQVARIDASNWAISARGFNDSFANKLLVMVDGRTIYTPLFSGVYWDIQHLMLEDIDRIEVIRGPGATLWGANAVNGIINIITKKAADTQGVVVSALAGNEDRLITSGRYGANVKDNLYWRSYAQYENRDASETTAGSSGNNSWYNTKAGFRTDWDVLPTRNITIQGDIYDAGINLDLFTPSLSNPPVDFIDDQIESRGANMLARWREKHGSDKESTFQTYFDFQSPDYSSLKQEIYTLDFDYQTAWNFNARNELIWGGGFRYITDELEGTPTISVTNSEYQQMVYSAFLQDQYALIPDELFFTLGSKFEHNRYTGFDIQPSARLAWYPDEKQTVWSSISRAVRTPSRAEYDINYDILATPPSMIEVQGNHTLQSEEMIAYELGYRVKAAHNLTFDVASFINDYDELRTYEIGATQITPDGIVDPFTYANLGEGKTYGFEISSEWDVNSRWNVLASYSYINGHVKTKPSSTDFTLEQEETKTPQNQFSLRSQVFLPQDVRLVNILYYVDELRQFGIDDYMRFDTQVIWQPTHGVELSLVGQNLLDSTHPEFGAPLHGLPNEIERAFYGKVTLRY